MKPSEGFFGGRCLVDIVGPLSYRTRNMRLGLAIRAFFAILFGRSLPGELMPKTPESLPSGIEDAKAALEASRAPEPPAAPPVDPQAIREGAAVQVLAVLQSGGRLLDFLSEEIDGYEDADIGAAVRDVHRGCKKAIAEHFPILPIRSEEESSSVTVPAGFDPNELRLVGNVVGDAPFTGTLEHRGWKVEHVKLPRIPEGEARFIVAPAEVEV